MISLVWEQLSHVHGPDLHSYRLSANFGWNKVSHFKRDIQAYCGQAVEAHIRLLHRIKAGAPTNSAQQIGDPVLQSVEWKDLNEEGAAESKGLDADQALKAEPPAFSSQESPSVSAILPLTSNGIPLGPAEHVAALHQIDSLELQLQSLDQANKSDPKVIQMHIQNLQI